MSEKTFVFVADCKMQGLGSRYHEHKAKDVATETELLKIYAPSRIASFVTHGVVSILETPGDSGSDSDLSDLGSLSDLPPDLPPEDEEE